MSYGYRDRPAVGGTLRTVLPASRIGEPLSMTERRTRRQIREETLIATFQPLAYGTLTFTNAGVPAAWATMRGAATATTLSVSTLAPLILADGGGANWASMARAFLYYDVSDVLKLSSEIVRASLRLWTRPGTAAYDYAGSLDVVPFTGTTPPAAADYDQFGTTNLVAAPTLAALEAHEGAYRSFVLNEEGRAYISLTGTTMLGLRIASDTDDAEPALAASDSDAVQFEVASSYPPILTVEFIP